MILCIPKQQIVIEDMNEKKKNNASESPGYYFHFIIHFLSIISKQLICNARITKNKNK